MTSDEALMLEFQGGSRAAFEELFARYRKPLYGFFGRRLYNSQRAEDLVQETFLEALRARKSFAGRASERTWLIGILRHKILDHYRRSGREQAVLGGRPESAAAESGFDRRGHWKVAPEAWAGEPSRKLETREFWDQFGRCLSRLPRGLADAFFLREVDGLGADEVQDLLGISPANLWARLHRARTQIGRAHV